MEGHFKKEKQKKKENYYEHTKEAKLFGDKGGSNVNLIDKEIIADILSKYDLEKHELKKKYIIKRLCLLAMAIISVILVIIGNNHSEYFAFFILVAVILFIIACKVAKSTKFNYRYDLASVWENFMKNEFSSLIATSLEGGQFGFGVSDDTFNYLDTGDDVNTLTHGAVSSIYNNERITVTNYQAYGTKEDKQTGIPYHYELFNGIAVMKDIKKTVESEIVITPTWLSGLIGFNKISMDNSRFNKQFKIYTHSDMDAYISLTPAVMETMLDVIKEYDIKAFVIKNDRIYVFIDREKLIFDMQNERRQKTKDYKKALKYMTVEHTYQNLSDFITKYMKIIDSVNKINV